MKFTVEITELVPNYAHITVEAESVEEAIAKAKDSDTDQWTLDWECTRPRIATGAWEGEEAYQGEAIEFADPELQVEAFKALDEAGISLLVGLSVDGIIEDRGNDELPPVPRETILEAIGNVAEGDWSDVSTGAKEAVYREIEQLMENANG